MSAMSKVWFITGATRGLGAEIAKAALAAGNKVVATGRKPQAVTEALGDSDNLLATALDVTRPEQVDLAVKAAVEKFGRIDVLVNNAGYGHLALFEETTPDEMRAQFETNVFGLMAVTRAVVPLMRTQRSGRIFNISSVSGLKGSFGASAYNASKFASGPHRRLREAVGGLSRLPRKAESRSGRRPEETGRRPRPAIACREAAGFVRRRIGRD
jgi:NAD(P)-dependent dehydrogenase (short-subunit alcohol dehydrogenase family)